MGRDQWCSSWVKIRCRVRKITNKCKLAMSFSCQGNCALLLDFALSTLCFVPEKMYSIKKRRGASDSVTCKGGSEVKGEKRENCSSLEKKKKYIWCLFLFLSGIKQPKNEAEDCIKGLCTQK